MLLKEADDDDNDEDITEEFVSSLVSGLCLLKFEVLLNRFYSCSFIVFCSHISSLSGT